MPPIVLSHIQSAEMLQARHDQKPSVVTSSDLGMTLMEVRVLKDGIRFAGGESLDWDQVADIDSNKTTCFYLENNVAKPIKGFSEATGRYYSLMPTELAPTMLISGIPMNRSKVQIHTAIPYTRSKPSRRSQDTSSTQQRDLVTRPLKPLKPP